MLFFHLHGVDPLLGVYLINLFFHLIILEALRHLPVFSAQHPLVLGPVFSIVEIFIMKILIGEFGSTWEDGPWGKDLGLGWSHVVWRFNSGSWGLVVRALNWVLITLEDLGLGISGRVWNVQMEIMVLSNVWFLVGFVRFVRVVKHRV